MAGRSGDVDVLDVVAAGHRGDAETARHALTSPDAHLREAALGALARSGALETRTVVAAIRHDPSPAVRRRACDLAATIEGSDEVTSALCEALGDDDPLVVESACWALGETCAGPPPPVEGVPLAEGPAGERPGLAAVVGALGETARSHGDARAREAAVAALGAIGDERGLPAVLDALGDRPGVRRRAVVALAAFEGDEVDRALRASAQDRDWQVREVAEILLDE